MYPTRHRRAVPAVALGLLVALSMALVLTGCGPRSAEGLYQQAVAKAKTGDLTGSMIDLKNALQKDENFGPARRLLGEHYLRMGDPLSAINELTRAQKLGQPAAAIAPEIVRAQLDAGQFAEVLKAMDKFTADRMDAQMWALRAEALAETGNFQGAAAALSNSLARDPKNADAHLGAARLAWATNDLISAKRQYENAVQLAPGAPRGWLLKGEFELGTGQVSAAATSFNTALGQGFGIDKTKARIGLARCMLVAKDLDGADQQIKAVLQQLPDLPMAHYLSAYIEFQRHNWDAAEDQLLQVLKRAPDHLQSLLLKGAVNAEQKKYLQAEVALTRVIAAMPADLKARKLLANIYMREGETAKAVAVLEVAPASSTGDAQYQSLLGGALMRDGQTAKAVATMEKAAQLAPDTVAVRTQLALSKLAAGDAAGAINDLRAIATTKQGGDHAQQLLVVVLLREKKFDDALAETERMKKLTPTAPVAYNLAAAAWLGKHDDAKAESELQAALRLNPKFTAAKVNLAKIAVARKDFTTGARLYAEARAEDPQSTDPVLGLAGMEFQRKNEKAAVALLEGARKKWPDAVEPRLILTQMYLQHRQFAQAEGPAREAVALQPTNVEAASLYGKALLGQNKMRPALDVLERIAPKAATDASLQYDLALARASVGDAKGGSDAANKAVTYSDRKSVPALILAARLSLEQNRIEDARRDVAQIRAAMSKNASAATQAALALLDGDLNRVANHWPAAVDNYSRAFALAPTSPALGRLAVALNATGRGAEARTKLSAWLKAHPNDTNAKFRLADLQMASGQSADAMRSYEALASTDSSDAVVHNNLAWLYLNNKDTARGLASAEKAYSLARNNPNVMDTLGWLRFKSGDKKDEVLELLQSAAAESKNPEVRYHVAEVLAAQGKTAQARAELDSLLAASTPPFASKAAAQALRQKL